VELSAQIGQIGLIVGRARSITCIAIEEFCPGADRSAIGLAATAGVYRAPMTRAMGSDEVRRTARECAAFLGPFDSEDWTQPIEDMDWTVAKAVAHMSGGLLWYSNDLSAGMPELDTMDAHIKDDAAPADLVRSLLSFANVLACVIDGSGPDARGYHPAGIADASGFAAMATDEMLVHTDDAGRGLGRDFRPPADLAEAALRRLFPWAPPDVDPWDGLKWANGRVELAGNGRLSQWRWHCAPLSEWDGTVPGVRS
jgi:uncharacterized protein (TIGR03083 family)